MSVARLVPTTEHQLHQEVTRQMRLMGFAACMETGRDPTATASLEEQGEEEVAERT